MVNVIFPNLSMVKMVNTKHIKHVLTNLWSHTASILTPSGVTMISLRNGRGLASIKTKAQSPVSSTRDGVLAVLECHAISSKQTNLIWRILRKKNYQTTRRRTTSQMGLAGLDQGLVGSEICDRKSVFPISRCVFPAKCFHVLFPTSHL